jgi:hypothetical protein
MLNALPKPTSVACFLEALDRPLSMQAVNGRVSAQPAVDEHSPRFFLFSDPLFMTVVPAGTGRDVLELSVLQPGDRSMSAKAEIPFPVAAPLALSDPFTHIENESRSGTECRLCHGQEARLASITDAPVYVSKALRPRFLDEAVPLPQLMGEAAACDRAVDAQRCEILSALFSGPFVEHDFPPEMAVCLQ